jgi:5-methylcytosine-specific restriction endonuclease McrA
MAVFVLDKQGKPLMPCSEKRARLLLKRGRARVHRITPFVIRLVDRLASESKLQPIHYKLDPGGKKTGIALVLIREDGSTRVLFLLELKHRGDLIRDKLTQRRNYRRARRNRKTRYRKPRFQNRRRKEGWLPPSLRHRIDTVMSWFSRMKRWSPITEICMELNRFDTQLIQNPEIGGVEYQQGELAGYELREYLLEKWGRKCAYCGKTDIPLQIEHIEPRARGGSNRASNLTLACEQCNQKKGNKSIEQFLKNKPELRKQIHQRQKTPLRDAACINATRWQLYHELQKTGLPVKIASGGRTKYNRSRLNIPKTHALDAACVGDVTALVDWQCPVLEARCMGRGQYQRTRLDKNGRVRGYCTRTKQIHGFQTGDLVRAVVPKGKKAGVYIGRVAIRATGSFNIQTASGTVQGISYKHCHILQRSDGYSYHFRSDDSSPTNPSDIVGVSSS